MKKMIQKSFCDLCGKEIVGTSYTSVLSITSYPDKITRIVDGGVQDLCNDCVHSLLDRMEAALTEACSEHIKMTECVHPLSTCVYLDRRNGKACSAPDGPCVLDQMDHYGVFGETTEGDKQ